MEKITVICPKGVFIGLTSGKEYEAVKHATNRLLYHIVNDNDFDAHILLKDCGHLYGGDWIIKKY